MGSKLRRYLSIVVATTVLSSAAFLVPTGYFAPDVSVSPYVATNTFEALSTVWSIEIGLVSGSGVVVSSIGTVSDDMLDMRFRILMLTADHVAMYSGIFDEEIRATYGGTVLTEGKVIASHPELDVAIVEFYSDTPQLPVRVRTSEVQKLEEVFSVGYAGGEGEQWIGSGLQSGKDRATAPGAPGDSGGAVLDSNGMLVGIISQLDRYGPFWIFHHLKYESVTNYLGWLSYYCPNLVSDNPSYLETLDFEVEEPDELLEEPELPELESDGKQDPPHVPELPPVEPSPTPEDGKGS